MDIAPLLGAINVPTLVMHGTEDRNVPLEVGRHLAQHPQRPVLCLQRPRTRASVNGTRGVL